MTDLRDDLRSYFDRVTEEVRAGTVGAVSPAPVRRSPRRGWLVAAAIVAMVAVVGGLVLTRSSDDDRVDPVDEVRTDVVASPDEIRAGWERVPNAFPDDAFVNDVASGPAGFVAVGLTFVPNGTTDDPTEPAIWHSGDGRSWNAAPVPISDAGRNETVAVTAWRDGYVALVDVGGVSTLWRSPDGLTWSEPEPSPSLPTLPGGKVTRLLADGESLIAYGDGAWVSSDGITWARGDLDAPVHAIVRDGDRLVALAGRSAAAGTTRVFTSTDGRHWTLAADLGPERDPGSSALVAWSGGWWVTSFPGDSDARSALWQSRDARDWDRVDADVPRLYGIDRLLALGPYLVATGWDADARPSGWVSIDGRDWVPTPDLGQPPGGRLGIAASDGRTVVATCGCEMRDVYRWTVPTPRGKPPTAATIPSSDSPVTEPAGTATPRVAVRHGLVPLDTTLLTVLAAPVTRIDDPEGWSMAGFLGVHEGRLWIQEAAREQGLESRATPLDRSLEPLHFRGSALSTATTADARWLFVREPTNPDEQYRLLRYPAGASESDVDLPVPTDGQPAGAIAVGAGAVWVPLRSGVARVDVGTGVLDTIVPLPFDQERSVVVLDGRVVVSDRTGVQVLDPATNVLWARRELTAVPDGVRGLLVVRDDLWVDVGGRELVRLDGQLRPTAEVPFPALDGGWSIAGDGSRLWAVGFLRVGGAAAPAVPDLVALLIDPSSATVVRTVVVHRGTGDGVWFSDSDELLVSGVRASDADASGRIDPGLHRVDVGSR